MHAVLVVSKFYIHLLYAPCFMCSKICSLRTDIYSTPDYTRDQGRNYRLKTDVISSLRHSISNVLSYTCSMIVFMRS